MTTVRERGRAAAGAARERRAPGRLAVNGRLYRLGWTIVVIPLVVAAVSVIDPVPLPRPSLPPTFDAAAALALADELASAFPDREPGSKGALEASAWVEDQLRASGYRVERHEFTSDVAREGDPPHVNLVAYQTTAPSTSRSGETIVVVAHRDNSGETAGVVDNASGTGVLLELARELATTSLRHTLVFVSTDGGTSGAAAGAHELARLGRDDAGSPFSRQRALAVVAIDSVGTDGPARLVLAGTANRIAAPALVASVADALAAEAGSEDVGYASPFSQLVGLAQPVSILDSGPFLGARVSAVTVTTEGERSVPASADVEASLGREAIGRLGRGIQSLIASLDQAAEVARGTSAYLYVGGRGVRGWAIALALLAAVVPVAIATLDLALRTRRGVHRLAAGFRSLRTRLAIWLTVLAVGTILTIFGALPEATGRPVAPGTGRAGDWAPVAVGTLAATFLVARAVAQRWLRHRPRTPAETGDGGHLAAMALLLAVTVGTVLVNPYAVLFLLPSLHAWLWLGTASQRARSTALVLWAAGFAGPAVLALDLALRFGLGWDAPWYLLTLASTTTVPVPLVVLAAAWLACAAQLAAIAIGRYTPAPARSPQRRARRERAATAPADG